MGDEFTPDLFVCKILIFSIVMSFEINKFDFSGVYGFFINVIEKWNAQILWPKQNVCGLLETMKSLKLHVETNLFFIFLFFLFFWGGGAAPLISTENVIFRNIF